MHIIGKLMLASVALGAITACSGSDSIVSRGVTISPLEQASRTFAARAGGNIDAGGAIEKGETLTARSVSTAGQLLEYGGGNTSLKDAKVSVERNAAGELNLYVNGTRRVFTPQDRATGSSGSAYGYAINDDTNKVYINVANFTGDLDDLLTTGSGYAEALFVQTNQVPEIGNKNVRAFAILGTETRDADLAGLPSATYTGTSAIKVTPDNNFAGTSDEIEIKSNLAMSADFGAGTVSGRLSDIRVVRANGNSVDRSVNGTIAMNTATFDTNGYAGTLSPDTTYRSNAPVNISTGSYSGAFYGPVANQAAGVISLNGRRGGEDVNGIGFFNGNHN
jgi:hypothetical protein